MGLYVNFGSQCQFHSSLARMGRWVAGAGDATDGWVGGVGRHMGSCEESLGSLGAQSYRLKSIWGRQGNLYIYIYRERERERERENESPDMIAHTVLSAAGMVNHIQTVLCYSS